MYSHLGENLGLNSSLLHPGISLNVSMGNTTDQKRLEQNEQDLEKMRDSLSEQMAALEGRISKKQEATNRIFSQLLEGQMRLLEKKGTRAYGHGRLSKKQKGTNRILAQLLEVQMRLLEMEGSRSYGHGGHQEFSHDQREPRDRREEDEPFNFSNQERGYSRGNWKFRKLDLLVFNGDDPDLLL